MSWQDQGRQEHGWFGNGTGSHAGSSLFARGGLGQRIDAIAHGAVASLPPALRRRGEAQRDAGISARLTEVMAAWVRGAKLDKATFAERFFGRAPDDPIVAKLRRAAQGADMAQSHAELRDAAGQLADAKQAIGLDQWPRFLADAQDRARDPATIAAVEESHKPPDLRKDAIRPAYPVETAFEIAAAGLLGGPAAAARTAGSAVLRQVVRGQRARPPQAAISADRRIHILDGDSTGGGHRPGVGTPGKSEFPVGWSDDKIINAIETVANDPAAIRTLQPNGRLRVEGTSGGIDIRVIIDRDGKSIWTAHPVNMPRNP